MKKLILLLVISSFFGRFGGAFAQCFEEGYKGEQLLNYASGVLVSPGYRSNAVVGQTFIADPSYSTDNASALGYWSKLLTPPSVGFVKASDGDQPGRVVLEWGLAPNTSAETKGYTIYRDNILLSHIATGINSFLDYQITPGIYYTYEVTAKNQYGEGARTSDVGYVNANGSVSGRITTFAGNSVEGALVTLTPSTNQTLNFNGNGGLYIDTIEGNPALLIDSLFTFSLWMKANSYAGNGMLFDFGKSDGVNFWMETGSDNSVSISMATTAGTKTIKHIFTSQLYFWHHIAGVYNGRELILYVDGQVISSVPVPVSSAIYQNHQIAIGAINDKQSMNQRFNGYIDDIRILSKAQRTSEINKFMKNTLPSDYPGLVAYWKLDEGKGTKVTNLVEKARFGMLCQTSFSSVEPGVKSSGISNSSGHYLIQDVNYGNGTSFTATPSKYVSFNYALEFSSIDSHYVETPRFTIPDASTIELWFNPYVLNGTQYLMSNKGQLQFDVYLNNSSLMLNINGQVQTIGTIATTKYHLLTIVRNGNSVTTYIDSDMGTSQNFTFNIPGTGDIPKWHLGASKNLTDFYFGLIDGLVVWDRILSVNEIQLHNSNGVLSTDEQTGITTYLGLNDVTGTKIANDVMVNGVTEYGDIHGAVFTDNTAYNSGIEHVFNPNSRIVTLNIGSFSSDGQDFTDNSPVPISGIFKYENTNCPIKNAEVRVNGYSTTPPTFTDEEGKWTVSLEPGSTAYISVFYQGHTIFPTFFEVKNAQTPKAGILFVDKTVRNVSGFVAGGHCKKMIVPAQGTAKVTLASTDGCFEKEFVITDANTSGAYQFTNVPPIQYTLSVSQHTISLIKDFFDTEGGKEIDLKDSSLADQDFIYTASPQIELTAVDTNNSCGVLNLKQGFVYSTDIKVYEDYLGSKCYLDTVVLTISDGIGLAHKKGFTGTDTMTTGTYNYKFYAGEANIVSPYLKSTQVIANVKGTTVSESFEAVVLGQRKRASTYTTVSPQIPVTILRDPPGDQSFAAIEKDSAVCLTNMNFTANNHNATVAGSIYAGPDITIETGVSALFAFVSTELEVDVTADMNFSSHTNDVNQITTEKSACTSFSEIISTSTDLVGSDGDVYIGAALNLLYGMADNLVYNDTVCDYKIYQTIIVDATGFNTFYVYSQKHLVKDVIPSNYLLGDSASAKTWEKFIALNDSTKKLASLIENRSFDAGVVYEKSQTTEISNTVTTDFTLDVGTSFGGAGGVTVNGVGFVVGKDVQLSLTTGSSNASNTTTAQSINYTLADDDIGDNFTVDIKKDTRFGTPVFKLISGESSCPHEKGTQPRDGVQILVDNNKVSTKLNVSTDEAAIFNLFLGNTSQSQETRIYGVGLVGTSNPYGATLLVNGTEIASLVGGFSINYTLAPNVGQFVTLALERGPDPNIFDYTNIKVIFQSICDTSISDTVTLNAHFVEPCSSVNISDPQNNWVLTPADNGIRPFVLDGYDETDPDLELIRVQYRKTGSPTWVNIANIEKDSLGASFTAFNWTVGNIDDADYELRAISVCLNGIPAGFSAVVPGKIERNPPEILGTPQPSDGIYNPGDEISVTFTEAIQCAALYYADQFNLNNIGLYDKTTSTLVNANVQCVGNKITITPAIPTIYLENHTLEVRIKLIKDLAGNFLAPTNTGDTVHKWEFYVNVSPIGWVGSNVDEVKLIGAPHSFQRIIANTGGNNVNYTITVPSYLTASFPSGSLTAGQQKVITFTVDSQMASGNFSDTLILSSSYGTENLAMSLRVMCAPPAWSVNASQYLHNMSFTVALDIEEIVSADQYDMVAGIIDGQVRGVANLQYITSLNKYLAFLTVYGNDADINKQVKFKVWDASECKLYDMTADSWPFTANGQVGTPLVEDTIHTLDVLVRTLDLNAGWNWISFNLKLSNDTVKNVLSGLSYPTNGLIKSQTLFSQYYPALNNWVGSLDTIRETEMYQVKLDSSKALDFYGHPINVDSTEIPLVVGWNWIGYLPQVGMPPNTALKSLNPYNGDIIKNQYLFAQYVAGFGWIGNLTYMNPPSGFLYKSSVADTLKYPENATSGNRMTDPRESEQKMLAEFEMANFYPNRFSGNMNIVGTAFTNGNKITGQGDKVYAYINGEIRGVAESMEFDGTYVFFLTVFGHAADANSAITFNYFNAQTETLSSVNEELTYAENNVVGLVQSEQPFTIGNTIATGIENVKAHTTNILTVYPNPVTENTMLGFYSETKGAAELTIYDNTGRTIFTKKLSALAGVNTVNFNELLPSGSLTAGLYMVSVSVNNQTHKVRVMIR